MGLRTQRLRLVNLIENLDASDWVGRLFAMSRLGERIGGRAEVAELTVRQILEVDEIVNWKV
jgi:hypothetical protein